MNLTFAPKAWDSYLYWQKTDKAELSGNSLPSASTKLMPCGCKAVVKRINTLIKDIQRTPFEGIGKPEPLKHALSGFWSRRINDEHRIVYKVTDNAILIAQLHYHY